MRKFKILPLLLLLLTLAIPVAAQKKTQKTYIPWSDGKLVVSETRKRYSFLLVGGNRMVAPRASES